MIFGLDFDDTTRYGKVGSLVVSKHGTFEIIENNIFDTTRWSYLSRVVVKDPNGAFWERILDNPATEMQESWDEDEDSPAKWNKVIQGKPVSWAWIRE